MQQNLMRQHIVIGVIRNKSPSQCGRVGMYANKQPLVLTFVVKSKG